VICKSCSFVTDRLIVNEWHLFSVDDKYMASAIAAILTPRVTQTLPEVWRGEYSEDRAAKWLDALDREAATLLVLDRSSKNPIGLIILFENSAEHSRCRVRVGYILAETAWGKGYATELLRGLVSWCRDMRISSIVGGVEQENVASQRVMEKNGFVVLPNEQADGELLYELVL
jgi:ribosomal-protein-alanine N-acetyltransferase